jgi:hypothetical protein
MRKSQVLNSIASTSRSKFVCRRFAALWSSVKGKKVRPVIEMQEEEGEGKITQEH